MKLLLLFAARGGVGEAFEAAIRADALRIAAAAPAARVTLLRQLPDDAFARATPSMRPYEGTLEVVAEAFDADALEALAARAGERLEAVLHADLSGALIGVDRVVIPSAPTPVRYQYLMRRKAGTTHAQYLAYYFEQHSRFGFLTPGIDGYAQFHVEPEASRGAARAAGFGSCGVDSVSELHMQSLAGFLEALALKSPGAEAAADEERFVDRPNSVSFTSAVLWRSWVA